MRVQPALPVPWRESFKAFAEGIDAAQKPSDSASLGQKQRDPRRGATPSCPRSEAALVCRDGTKAHDPFWDGPRLTPIFVTQLLGQVMEPEHGRRQQHHSKSG